MGFISWYFRTGLPQALEVTQNYLDFVDHYFSLGRLSSTLIAPWRKTIPEKKKGFSFGKVFYQLSYDLISRVVGLVVRLVVIGVGLICWVGAFLVSIIVVDVVFMVPVVLVPQYLTWKKQQEFERAKSKDELIKKLIKSQFGNFLVRRTNIESEDLIEHLQKISAPISEIKKQAGKRAKEKGRNYINAVDVIVSILNLDPDLYRWFDEKGYEADDVGQLISWYLLLERELGRFNSFWRRENLLSKQAIGKDWSSGYTANLDEYCEDLSRQDLRWYPFVGRDAELNFLIDKIESKHQPDILLVGEAGMGRHSLIRGLAKRIQWHEVPKGLFHQRVLLFQTEKFLSQTNERDAGEVLFSLLNEADSAGNVILVIDAIHQLLVHKKDEHDMAGAISRALESNRLRLIGITNRQAFNRNVRANNSLMKYMTPIELKEMDRNNALAVCFEQIQKYEARSKIYFTYEAIKEAVDLAERYITNDSFPEKALDVISEVVATAERKKEKRIGTDIVREVVSQITHVPVESIGEDEGEKLLNLEDSLHERIVEQDEAILKIAKAIRRARTGVKSQTKPLGSFLFLGPTGVGKTETAKVLSETFFHTNEMIRLDMAEFQTDEGVKRLIGSYDNEDPGVLAGQIESQPYGVLLLDEFEKAPREIHNLFLSILDEGSFTSANGKKIDCRNLIIIATSNAGSQYVAEMIDSGNNSDLDKTMVDYLLKQGLFAPELLNRFDGVVFYKPLSESGLVEVTKLLLNALVEEMKLTKNVEVYFGDGVAERVVSKGYDKKFGARSIQHYINDEIGDEIAKLILTNPKEKQIVFE